MKLEQLKIKTNDDLKIEFDIDPTLILVFGSTEYMKSSGAVELLRKKYPNVYITGCSTAGEIAGLNVLDDTLVITAVEFHSTKLEESCIKLDEFDNSMDAGKALINNLKKDNLRHVLVLSDGLNVNGAELVKGINSELPKNVNVTGGLAGDGANFNTTYVINNKGEIKENQICAIGFYGDNLKIGYGSMGGWDSFGIERLVTKSESNVLYELDGQPALKLYKSFLGDKAKDLPSSGLLFPLSLRINPEDKPIVRTILGVDEETQSMTFAGDIPKGAHVRLMKANVNRLIDGAGQSAEISLESLKKVDAELGILISCVGRKLVLKQLVEEEVESVSEILGNTTTLTGFYSYGEIAPFGQFSSCELHNQTMTITVFSEQ